jgi:hypothetical protein
VNKIDDIKIQVKQLIKDNLYREVTPETKLSNSGIYMIYIDNFISDKIIPIYIGQAKDIQRRYKQHYSEILALNRLSYDEYYKYFFSKSSSFYEGGFKACKIFKYMLENNCTLQDFRMIVIEEVEEEYLDEKEQDYFKKLLPSFFGFNQLDSFLNQQKFRFSSLLMSNSELEDFLSILQDDIKGIYSYYEYGFTRFNFEHSIPKDISYLLEEKGQLDTDIMLKFNEAKLSLNGLFKQYIPDYEELQRLIEQKNKYYEVYKIASDNCKEALDLLKREISRKFEELNIYNEVEIRNFIHSIVYKNNPDYKKLFNKYLKSQKCKLNFYKIFDEQIKDLNKKLEEKSANHIPYSEVMDLYVKREDVIRPERYKLIFPSFQFDSYSLKDRNNNLSININEDNDVLNTCHIQIYISNNALNKSLEISKEPFIIRFDYCYIDNEENKTEINSFIDNETTRNCQSGIVFFEKDFYDMWAIKKEKFKISSQINNETDNSFISVLAEYKHGINDYTLKDKNLIKLSDVLEGVKQLIDDETRFNIEVSESANCLRRCLFNEGLLNNEFAEQILLTKKLLKLKKRKNTRIKTEKEVVDKIGVTVKRAEAFKQKVLLKSDTAIKVLNYVSSKEKVTAKCNSCGYEWDIRSDHLLRRTYCPSCRKR